MSIREKLIELLAPTSLEFEEAEYLADYLVKNGVTVQEWISVNDRLPENSDKDRDWSVTVLFRTFEGHIHSGNRNIGRPQNSFYDDDWTPPFWLDESENLDFEDDEITHWMPLPEPPRGNDL